MGHSSMPDGNTLLDVVNGNWGRAYLIRPGSEMPPVVATVVASAVMFAGYPVAEDATPRRRWKLARKGSPRGEECSKGF